MVLREHELNNAEKTVSYALPVLTRQKRTTTPITFECPIDRCRVRDCYVTYPKYHLGGKWWWGVLETALVELAQISAGVMKVTYRPSRAELRELWCFTKRQLNDYPD